MGRFDEDQLDELEMLLIQADMVLAVQMKLWTIKFYAKGR